MDWDSVLLWTSCVTLGKSLENLVLKNNRPITAARMKHQSSRQQMQARSCLLAHNEEDSTWWALSKNIDKYDQNFRNIDIKHWKVHLELYFENWHESCYESLHKTRIISVFQALVLCICVKPITSRIFMISRDAVRTIKYWIYRQQSTPYSNQLAISIS